MTPPNEPLLPAVRAADHIVLVKGPDDRPDESASGMSSDEVRSHLDAILPLPRPRRGPRAPGGRAATWRFHPSARADTVTIPCPA